MAKGITETDVHTAADEIITAGERPTVERIRAHLGTGSPNTVTRWLDTWWKQLGERLQKQQAHRALPQAPDALAFLAGEWWSLAMEHARANAEDAISQRRAALQAEQAALNTAKEAFRDEEALLVSTSKCNTPILGGCHVQNLSPPERRRTRRHHA
ncbi:MAG: DNA-binding protein [Pigmentiphaga sp.]